MQNISEIYIKIILLLEPKWLDNLKKFEQVHKIWSYSSGFAQKSLINIQYASIVKL